jgi:AraC-like DNA-binding protein
MLDDPAVKIIDVAVALGYSDGAHFTRTFRRWCPVGPLEYRRSRVTRRAPRSSGGPAVERAFQPANPSREHNPAVEGGGLTTNPARAASMET